MLPLGKVLENLQKARQCDQEGQEREAISYYQKALELGLTDQDRQTVLLGLGSSLRCLGQ